MDSRFRGNDNDVTTGIYSANDQRHIIPDCLGGAPVTCSAASYMSSWGAAKDCQFW